MLTPQMNQTEVVGDVMADLKWLYGQVRLLSPALKREIRAQMKTGQQTVCVVRERQSPRGNKWTVMFVWHRDRQEMPVTVFYTLLQNEDGIYAYSPNQSPERGMLCFCMTPHFFRRYRERMGLGDGLTAQQVIRRYMRDNNDGHLQQGPDHKGRPSWNDSTHDGVTLGEYVSPRLFLCNTFVTRDMAYPGRQQRAFTHGEKQRKKVRQEGDLRQLQHIADRRDTTRERLRLCDEAVAEERAIDERIRQRREQEREEEEKEGDG